jgi:hypothetical protein
MLTSMPIMPDKIKYAGVAAGIGEGRALDAGNNQSIAGSGITACRFQVYFAATRTALAENL